MRRIRLRSAINTAAFKINSNGIADLGGAHLAGSSSCGFDNGLDDVLVHQIRHIILHGGRRAILRSTA